MCTKIIGLLMSEWKNLHPNRHTLDVAYITAWPLVSGQLGI